MTRVAVVGAGIIGLSAAHALRKAGADVLVYESGTPGSGQSAGESRIFRHAHDDVRLAAFVRHSRTLWRNWESDFGVELVSPAGAIAIGDSVEDKLRVLSGLPEIPVELVPPGQLAARLPILAAFGGKAMLDAEGGAIRTHAAFTALTGELENLLVPDHVLAVRHSSDGGAEVRTGTRVDRFDHVVLCAGRGTAALARSAGLDIPIELAAHARVTFRVRADVDVPLPTFQDASGLFGETGVYAAPSADSRHFAVGLSEVTAARPDGSLVDPSALESLATRASAYVRKALPGLDPEPAGYVHCWVTRLPWGDDGVGIWSTGNLSAVGGHNLFKQAPALGEALAETAMSGVVPAALRPESRLGTS
ncbi:glycine/D-amino acid oxidase, deaminating [Pseudarthrobacter phenanthrenivorans Sphe3]|uniref:Glycine/D-amino acid oxidase, deaminating n=1 Tax=Pseudarthrobacter phenanthrenivorans (strain DSM 18606 / JCM 16027 / LMG 23796 / Sphe3) TaxID=930171 RepID=F0M7A5_PSEPM|nr:FAD-dependent oxidoreductase [Pseudarthrobacter phenanthrenivorans]ADX72559.1 glycine/D-amino acid oxidase, deaminating [Pseudarthrobacter phenanthrenivorans Sphe3]